MCVIIMFLLPHSWLSMVNINKKDIAYLSDYHIVCTNREGGMMTTSHHYHQYAYDMINLAIYAQKMYNVISSNSLSLYRTLFFESFSSVYSLTRLPYYKIIWNKWYSLRLIFKQILSLMNRLQHDYFWHKVLFRHLFYWN